MATMKERLANPRERVYLPELLKEVSKTKDTADKVLLLRTFANKGPEYVKLMKDFVQCVWHPLVEFELPPGAPELVNSIKDYNLAPSNLFSQVKRLPYFIKGSPTFLKNQIKREQVFIQSLEQMFKPEADLFVMIKDKKINLKVYPGLNEKLIREAFSGWLPKEVPNASSTGAS